MDELRQNQHGGYYRPGGAHATALRRRVLDDVTQRDDVTVRAACRMIGVSESTVYRWLRALSDEGRVTPRERGEQLSSRQQALLGADWPSLALRLLGCRWQCTLGVHG